MSVRAKSRTRMFNGSCNKIASMKTCIVLVAFATSLTALSQTAKPRTATPHRATSSPSTSIVMGLPLPAGVLTSVDPHYRGMNVPTIYEILHRGLGSAKQSQYETKAQFDARIELMKGLTLFGNQKVGDQYTFVLGGGWNGGGSVSAEGGGALSYLRGAIQTAYDAESQVMTVTIPAVTGVGFGADHTAFGWGYSSRPVGHHLGQNAFGVKKTITESVSLQHTIEFESADISWLKAYCKQEFSSDLQCEVSVPATKASAMDGDIRVALGGTLKEPYTEEESGTQKATIDSPYETFEVQRGVFISPNQLVIFSGRSGEIVAQYSNAAFQQEYALHVEIGENKSPDWNNPICTGYLVRDAPISFRYQIDGGKEIDVFRPDKALLIQAKNNVTLTVPFCFIPRLTVLRDNVPQQLVCEKQTQFALNRSKCQAIGLPAATNKE